MGRRRRNETEEQRARRELIDRLAAMLLRFIQFVLNFRLSYGPVMVFVKLWPY